MTAIELRKKKAGIQNSTWRKVIRKNGPLLLFVLPGLLVMIINSFLPMFGLIMAFKNIDNSLGIFKSPFAGFSNFTFLFASSDAWTITRNTVLYNFVFIFLGLIISVFIAIAINELRNRVLSKTYQTIIIMPYFLSFVVIGYLVYGFLSPDLGFVNNGLLKPLGIQPIDWYSELKYWPYIFVLINSLVYCGIGSIVYSASILAIDCSLYESAVIDGASKGQQIRHITIPMLTPVMIVMTLINLGNIFRGNFGMFYQVPLANPVLIPVTDVIDTYVYRALVTMGNFGMVTAASLYQSVVGCILVLSTNYAVRKISPDNAMF